MPFLYAIQERIYEDGIPPAEGEWKRYDVNYIPVAEDVAKTSPAGCYKLMSNLGEEMFPWKLLWPDLRAEDKTKIGTGKPLKDRVGQELAGGDLVMVCDGKYTSLSVQEVVNFTPKKIRVRDVGGFSDGTPKNPSDVIKVDKSLFF